MKSKPTTAHFAVYALLCCLVSPSHAVRGARRTATSPDPADHQLMCTSTEGKCKKDDADDSLSTTRKRRDASISQNDERHVDDERTYHKSPKPRVEPKPVDRQQQPTPFTCSLYLAPSTLPHAGLGLFTAKRYRKGSIIGGSDNSSGGEYHFSDPFIEIEDHYKTLPYRGQQRFLSWLGYVWPRKRDAFYHTWEDTAFPEIHDAHYMDEGLNAAKAGFFGVLERYQEEDDEDEEDEKDGVEEYPEYYHRKVSAFAPGLSSLVNSVSSDSNAEYLEANIVKNSASERDDQVLDRVYGATHSSSPASSASATWNANTPHHGVTYVATSNIAAGTELLMDYGGFWWNRHHHHFMNDDGSLRRESPPYTTLDESIPELNKMKLPTEKSKRKDWTKKKRPIKELPFEEEYDSGDEEADAYELYWEEGEDAEAATDESIIDEQRNIDLPVDSSILGGKRDVKWLQQNGMCVDQIRSGESTIGGAGRGAFSNAFIAKGSTIAPAPLLVLKRDDITIYSSDEKQKILRDVLNLESVVGEELLLNYCWGHPESELLLLPYSPIVSYINHDGEKPNAEIRWPEPGSLGFQPDDWLELHPIDVLDRSGKLLAVIVALEDISPGDEIRISYGTDWEEAWSKHHLYKEAPFRHEIGVPQGFYPDKWLNTSTVYEVADIDRELLPGEILPLRWKHNGKLFLKGGFRVGLPRNFSKHMRSYAKERGIVRLYRHLLAENLIEDNDFEVWRPQGFDEEWFAHRYMNKAWAFDIHYVAAWDEAARQSFLAAFGRGGFGETVLKNIAAYNGYSNMTCIHASFMGMSTCDKSKTHADVYATDNSGYNFIFPIHLVNNSKPEFDIQADDANILVGVNYRYDSAFALGDYGYHKTRAISYDDADAMRIVIGIYCGQVTEKNAKQMQLIYHGEEPAPFMDQFSNFPENVELHWAEGKSLLPK